MERPISSRYRGISWVVILLISIQAGCSTGSSDTLCGSATVTATSEDANNVFTSFTGTQCDMSIEPDDADGVFILEIDMLDRSASPTTPRILFTLELDADEIPSEGSLDLQRADDISLAPAVYQEYEGGVPPDPAEGPFWSSNSGTITFATDTEGNIVATFEFDADNPSDSEDNTASGTIAVSGEVLVQEAIPTTQTCGILGTANLAFMLVGMVGISFISRRQNRS